MRMKKTKAIFQLVALLILAGCASPTVNVARFDTIKRQPTEANIDVYTSPLAIKRPYKEVALITAEEGWKNSEADLTQRMIAKAREIGAQGIILLGAEKQSSGGIIAGGLYMADDYNTTRCTAIVYTDAK
ncbi:MAG: hypothetical protein RLY20_2028 [Verrucomicrobiota bacterium]|jgi:uncharacterized lipoprotein YajG